MRTIGCGLLGLSALVVSLPARGEEELPYPQRVWTRYEAADPRRGGDVVIWVEQERIWYSVGVTSGSTNAMLFPPARWLEVTQITPTPKSPAITMIQVEPVGSGHSDFYRFTGFLRLKISQMRKIATNAEEDR